MFYICFGDISRFVVPGWSDHEHRESVPAEGYVAVLLGFPVAMAAQVPDRLDQCRHSVCAGVHAVPEKQARGRGGLQNALLVLGSVNLVCAKKQSEYQ